ncbi:hypothetical protein Pmani_037529 [Petrolisthes manimaculis]|uniref:Uncharacterized protein n=1 Tax=Petrolisthes manimaculis TaxID=1843537 RepID=A0AAE1TLE8_9EUCA|nr:hypothetical protein Pmani_037529 [Petrolisthes manimaculis]
MHDTSKAAAWLVSILIINMTQATQSEKTTSEIICSTSSSVSSDVTVTCLCPSAEKTLIIRDVAVNMGEEGQVNITLPANTTTLRVGECEEVHMSGPTLITLTNLHTLHLHDIKLLHTAYNFFMEPNTHLRSLHLSNTSFADLEDMPIIHAEHLDNVTLDALMMLKGTLKLLIVTHQDEPMNLISITNSNIEKLGEINISPRNVKNFVLQNNTIGTIMTGAIMHDSTKFIVQDNYITSIDFQALESVTYNFILSGNTIGTLALKSIAVKNATNIIITNNSFNHIERSGGL